MTTTPPNGNGNGFYTTKELLAKIDGKLDLLAGRVTELQLDQAVHAAKPHHDAAREEMESLRRQVDASNRKLATYAGGITVGAFVVQVLVRLLLG